MLTVIIVYGALTFISLFFVLILMITAPDGYEDNGGFHLGRKKKDVEK